MRLSEPPPEWMDARVEAYLDGALPPAEQNRFEHALAGDDGWEAEVFLARQVARGLHALPQPACPPEVTEAVLARARRQQQGAWAERLSAWLQEQVVPLWQPALAMAVLLLLVFSATLIGRPQPPPEAFAAAEVEQALLDVKKALGYVSEAGRQTGHVVRDDVITDRVVAPVQQALQARSAQPDNHPQR